MNKEDMAEAIQDVIDHLRCHTSYKNTRMMRDCVSLIEKLEQSQKELVGIFGDIRTDRVDIAYFPKI